VTVGEADTSGQGLPVGWIVAAVIGSVLAVLGLLAVAGVLLLKVTAAPPAAAPVTVVAGPIEEKPTDGGGDAPADAPTGASETVTLELTGTGERGTWYTLDGAIYEGDEALQGALADLAAGATKAGRKLAVRIAVVDTAGITAEAVAAARKICADAGAEVLPPAAAGAKAK